MIETAKFEDFREQLSTNNSFGGFDVGFSHFSHNFAMFFLNSQIWMNSFKEHIKTFSGYVSFVYITTIKMLSVFTNTFYPIVYTQKVMQPFHNGFIDGSKFNNSSVCYRKYSCFGFNGVDVKASIAVNIASKISKIQLFHVNSFIILYTHKHLNATVNDLGEWNSERNMRKSEHYGDIMREIRRGFPANVKRFYIGHKSNRLPILNSAAARLGQAMRETQDSLVRDSLESSASVVNCVGGSNGDLPTEMALSDTDDIVTLLQNNSAEYITNMIPGELKIGTSPIGDAYGCMLTTRMIPVLNNLQGFVRKFQYPNVSETLQSEWGGVNNIRFFVSEQGSVTPNASLAGNDVANCFVSAKEAYKVVWQAGGKARFIYLPPGYNNDPCMLRHTAGCSFYQGSCITNDLWIQNLRSTGI